MTEAASTSETSVSFYQTTRCNIPEDSHLHTRRRENLKSHLVSVLLTARGLTSSLLRPLFFRQFSSFNVWSVNFIYSFQCRIACQCFIVVRCLLFLLAEKCVQCSSSSCLLLPPLTYHLRKAIGLVCKSDVAAGCNMCWHWSLTFWKVPQFVILNCFKMCI
jgi:hypothetical protein